jgi:hypothetical protein
MTTPCLHPFFTLWGKVKKTETKPETKPEPEPEETCAGCGGELGGAWVEDTSTGEKACMDCDSEAEESDAEGECRTRLPEGPERLRACAGGGNENE